MMMRFILLNLAFVAATCNAAAQMSLGVRQRMLTPIVVGVRRATMNTSHQRYTNKPTVVEPSVTSVSRGGAAVCDGACKPPVKLLRWAYAAAAECRGQRNAVIAKSQNSRLVCSSQARIMRKIDGENL